MVSKILEKYREYVEEYKKGNIKSIEKDFSNPDDNTFKLFIINCKNYPIELIQKEINCKSDPIELIQKDKPDFSDLNLRKDGWKRVNKYTPEQKKFLENTSGYKEYKETILYKGPQGHAVLHANYRKDRHRLGIHLNYYEDKKPNTMEIVQSIFERGWGYKLEPPKESDLIGKSKEQQVNDSDLIEKLFGY